MNIEQLERKLIVLDYSFGPFWDDGQGGGDGAITIWQIVKGRLTQFYHPGEPSEIDNNRPIQLLKNRDVKTVYTPYFGLYLPTNNFLGLKMRDDGGEHHDETGVTDWIEYRGLCDGDYNWDRLGKAGLKVILIT